jgi:hypothetical protein
MALSKQAIQRRRPDALYPLLASLCSHWVQKTFGSAQELVETRILSRFLKNDKFCFCDRHALCLEQ